MQTHFCFCCSCYNICCNVFALWVLFLSLPIAVVIFKTSMCTFFIVFVYFFCCYEHTCTYTYICMCAATYGTSMKGNKSVCCLRPTSKKVIYLNLNLHIFVSYFSSQHLGIRNNAFSTFTFFFNMKISIFIKMHSFCSGVTRMCLCMQAGVCTSDFYHFFRSHKLDLPKWQAESGGVQIEALFIITR